MNKLTDGNQLGIELSRLQNQAGLFCNDPAWSVGLELEGWIFDKDLHSVPVAHDMVDEFESDKYTKEVIKNVFEINPSHEQVQPGFLAKIEQKLKEAFQQTQTWASARDLLVGFVGIPPHLPINYFNESVIADLDRYRELNQSLCDLRHGKPWQIDIKNKDAISYQSQDICLEGLTTSTQFHLKVPFKDLADVYNYAQLLAPFMVAISANAPFIDSKSLWMESRIPLFHQTVGINDRKDPFGCVDDRVRFGSKFISSVFELFAENLSLPRVLEPELTSSDARHFPYTRLHNSTIWRWNRLVLSLPEINPPHLRLEHRVQSAGVSPSDITSQLAFFVGIIAYWKSHAVPPASLSTFKMLRERFYQCAKYGLVSKITFGQHKNKSIKTILLEELLPQAKAGLLKIGIPKEEANNYIEGILLPRISKGLTGASWQVSKAQQLGSVRPMFDEYLIKQASFEPLHRWR